MKAHCQEEACHQVHRLKTLGGLTERFKPLIMLIQSMYTRSFIGIQCRGFFLWIKTWLLSQRGKKYFRIWHSGAVLSHTDNPVILIHSKCSLKGVWSVLAVSSWDAWKSSHPNFRHERSLLNGDCHGQSRERERESQKILTDHNKLNREVKEWNGTL